MPAIKGQPKPERTYEQKAELVEQICLTYESQQATIASCCQSAGISERAFSYWCAEFAEFAERYKKAKDIQENDYWESVIKPLQKRALQKHLEVEQMHEQSEVVYQGVKSKDESNNPILQHSTKDVLPNPSVLIFSMKGTYPDKFSDKQEVKHSGAIQTGFDVSKLTPAEADALLALMDKAKNE